MNIFVGRLAQETTEKDLYLLFKQYGYVDAVMLSRDKLSKRSRGYAYVIIKQQADAESAIAALNNHELYGEKMMVKRARPGEIRFIKEENY